MKDYSNVKIEKDVPVPDRGAGLTGIIKALQVGDSFLLPDAQRQSNLGTYGRQFRIKLISRKQKDGSMRIWRIE